MNVSEHKVLKKIFGLKRDEVAGSQREQRVEKLHNL
jgi:hypothetical protein